MTNGDSEKSDSKAAIRATVIVGTADVRKKADGLVQAAFEGVDKKYSAAREAFVASAQREADQALN
jgi:hypothetical protein